MELLIYQYLLKISQVEISVSGNRAIAKKITGKSVSNSLPIKHISNAPSGGIDYTTYISIRFNWFKLQFE